MNETTMATQENGITNKTSKGYLLEKLEVTGNLLALVEHLHDIPYQSQEVQNLIGRTRAIRQGVIERMFPEALVDMDYHCAFKHALLAYIQAKESVQNRLGANDTLGTVNEYINLDQIKSLLLEITMKYLKMEDLSVDQCWKCVEDRFMQVLSEGNYPTPDQGIV